MTILLAILMLAGYALILGAWFRFRKGDRRRALLMLAAGLIALGNVAIWLVPLE